MASSGPLLASSGPLLASSCGLFWPLPGLFLAFFWDSPKAPKFRGPQRPHLSVHKTCVSSSFSPNSGFLAFWGLFWPLPGLFWPFSGLFRTSSWAVPASSWPLFGLFLDSPKSPKFRGPQRRHFLFIKHCVSSSFSPNSGFLAFLGPLLASSGLFLASSGPLLASSCPLLASFWLSPRLCKISKIQALSETSFSVHKTLCFEQANSGFLTFWGFFVRNPAYPVVFGRFAPAASLRLRLGPVEDNDRRRRCPSPRWDAWKTLELNPKMLELRVVLGWAVCYAQVRAAWVCTHQRAPMTLLLNGSGCSYYSICIEKPKPFSNRAKISGLPFASRLAIIFWAF